MRHCFILAILLGGCIADFGDSSSSVEGDGEEDGGDGGGGGGDRDDCKIEGSVIGREGAVLQLGAKTVTFGNWVGKNGSPGEYVGFSLSLTGGTSVSYVVKASGELHRSTATTWMHPAGPNGGSDAPGISNVDMCDDDGGGGGGDGGGGDGGGDGGDGPIL